MSRRYIPALSFSWLTPLYDPALRLLMREDEIRGHLIRQMALRPGMRVLDVGCGTGTLAIRIEQQYPAVAATGLDGDPAVLARAVRKARRASVAARWDLGLATELPYAAASFDRVVVSLVIHHLTDPDKQRALREMGRVLRPGGELHILDFGPPQGGYEQAAACVMRRLEETAANLDGRLPGMIRAAGFDEPTVCRRFTVLFGPLSALRALKP
jgi:ubiquinone/menaquinone biosynthesis C-methylase UbiE